MNIEKLISPLIESQFPSFYRDEGPNFIAFVRAYYEWAEQTNQFIGVGRSIFDIKDVDTTSQETFVKYFKTKYIQALPDNILADKKLLVKHILELYRSKGTQRAYELLFRMLFNEDIQLFIPSQFILKPSDAEWSVSKYVEVSDNPYLDQLVGQQIYSNKNGATAIVESHFTKIVNNKFINVLLLSNLNGIFKFNESIYCDSVDGVNDNPPLIYGSLSTISIVNGGANFKVGDLLKVNGSGTEGVARVLSTTGQNGKVSFNLVSGGFGYSKDAVVTVTGGYGTGASFNIGDISNKQTYYINKDKLGSRYNTQMEVSSQGFTLDISSSTGTMVVGETITQTTANTLALDVDLLSGEASIGESFSNSTLGISNLYLYYAQGQKINVVGSDSDILNANLVAGAVLVSNVTNATIQLLSKSNKNSFTATGTVVYANTSQIIVDNSAEYFIPSLTVTGGSTGYNATISSVTRNTDWAFPYAIAGNYASNLDTAIKDLLTIVIKEVGSIAYLTNVNPGIGYSEDPTISIIEPDLYDLQIPDGNGGFYGYDAVVTGKAGTAVGVVTAVDIFSSGYGYIPNETIFLSSANNATSVTGVSVVDQTGTGGGKWINNKSFISNRQAIQDSNYYQNYSYEIIAKRMKDTYEKYVRDFVHPSGIALFGRYTVISELQNDFNTLMPLANSGITQSS